MVKQFKEVTDGFNGGGYPLMHVLDGKVYCCMCANQLPKEDIQRVVSHVHWEGSSVYCDECSKEIESAYGEENE